jgi:hypothetical protein
MNLLHLWWTGLTSPRRAFAELRARPAPQWGFWVVLVFNLAISATTLVRYLLGQDLLMPSALTFLPSEKYLLAEVFFLPPLRVLHWLLSAAVLHLGLRLTRHPGGFDQLLNMGGLGYLIVMPFILVTDWLFIAVGRYDFAEYVHSLTLPWSLILTVIGLNERLGVKAATALGLAVVGTPLTLPLLAIFAR